MGLTSETRRKERLVNHPTPGATLSWLERRPVFLWTRREYWEIPDFLRSPGIEGTYTGFEGSSMVVPHGMAGPQEYP